VGTLHRHAPDWARAPRRRYRQDDNDRHHELQECRQYNALLGFADILGGQGSLNDVLVEAPVRHVHDPQAAQQDGQTGKVLVVGITRRQNHVEFIGKAQRQFMKTGEYTRAARYASQSNVANHKAAQYQ
jgi:hypothetical protein